MYHQLSLNGKSEPSQSQSGTGEFGKITTLPTSIVLSMFALTKGNCQSRHLDKS